jgi:hypothetical protein
MTMRKRILSIDPTPATSPSSGELNVANIATVLVTSEAAGHPIEHAFDAERGRGARRWMAEGEGEQTLILAFDTPQTLRQVTLEVEETEVDRTQELQLAVSADGGQTYRELLRQEFNFSPPQTAFEREEWRVDAQGVTHLRLWIKPDKSGRPRRASLTSLALRAA